MKRGFQLEIECYADRSHNILKTGVIEFFWCFSKHLSKHRCAIKHIYFFICVINIGSYAKSIPHRAI